MLSGQAAGRVIQGALSDLRRSASQSVGELNRKFQSEASFGYKFGILQTFFEALLRLLGRLCLSYVQMQKRL